jgi:hypothetical protein
MPATDREPGSEPPGEPEALNPTIPTGIGCYPCPR